MANLMRSNPRGINTRDNNITRSDEYSTNSLNVYKDNNGNIRTREGFEKKYDRPALNFFTTKDNISYQGQTVKIDGDDWYIGDNGVYSKIPVGFNGGMFDYAERQIDHAEYSKSLYVTNTDKNAGRPLMKYDGQMLYRAGLPRPVITNVTVTSSAGAAATIYYRVFFGTKDANGVNVFGDYAEFSVTGGDISTDVKFFIDPIKDMYFSDLYAVPSINQNIGIDSSVVEDVLTVSSHNVDVDQYLLFVGQTPSPNATKVSYWLKVLATTATTITLDVTPITDDERQGSNPNDRFISITTTDRISNVGFFVAASDSISSNFSMVSVTIGQDASTNFDKYYFGWESGAATAKQIPVAMNWQPNVTQYMEDFYDPLTVKGLPPVARFITVYNDLLVMLSAGYGSEVSDAVGINPLTVPEGYNDDLYFSGNELGSTVETFPPFNSQPIGNTREGEASGVFANEDYLIAFKQRAIYSVVGDLSNGNYRVSDSQSSGIGCISHKSIAPIGSGCAFVSSRGVHLIAGASRPTEISDIVQDDVSSKLPDGYDFSKSIAVIDYLRELYILWVPYLNSDGTTYDYTKSKVIVYDYFRKDWWPWDGINAKGGMSVLIDQYNNYRIKFSDGIDVFELDDDIRNDNGVAINDYYWTNWENLGIPSKTKKFIDLKIYSMSDEQIDFKISSEANWIEGQSITNNEIKKKAATDRFVKQGLNRLDCYAMRFKISNGKINKRMVITALEYEYDVVGNRMKN